MSMYINTVPERVEYTIGNETKINSSPDEETVEISQGFEETIYIHYNEIELLINILNDCRSLIEEHRKEE